MPAPRWTPPTASSPPAGACCAPPRSAPASPTPSSRPTAWPRRSAGAACSTATTSAIAPSPASAAKADVRPAAPHVRGGRRTSRHTATASAGRAGGALLRHGYNPPTRFRRDASIVRRLRNATPPLLVCLLLTTPLLGRLAVDAAALPALVDPALLHGMSLGVLLLLG